LAIGVLTATLTFGAALAQTPPARSPEFAVQRPQTAPAPLFRQDKTAEPFTTILGVPVGVSAPVAAPYCNCAYGDFAGQPMTGQEAATGQIAGE
jgi:hypothetical protein